MNCVLKVCNLIGKTQNNLAWWAKVYDINIPADQIDFGNNGFHVIQPQSVQFQGKYEFIYGTA